MCGSGPGREGEKECEASGEAAHALRIAESRRAVNGLVEGGTPQPYCWLKDRFGLSWQVGSARLIEKVHTSGDNAATGRVMAAMMEMRKIDLERLERAYAG